ncbi:MAG: MFS transporter [Stellaceae bacterium]
MAANEPPGTTVAAERGLDVLNLFVANIQTGFGPFIAIYLTTRGWTQGGIGVALSIGTVVAMASQVPAGALVDVVPRKSLVAGLSLLAFTLSALLFAINPLPLWVYIAEALHGFSSATLGPTIAAISLALAGQDALGLRLGRNARFSAIGNASGAALMGAFGYYISSQSVFLLAAALTFPAIASVLPLRSLDGRIPVGHGGMRRSLPRRPPWPLFRDRRLMTFGAFVLLFTFGNAALLPMASVAMTERMPAAANLLIAAFIVLPQMVVAAISPGIGRYAQRRGRRPLVILGLAALAVRGLLFAVIANPVLLIPVQVLDGISGACFGVLIPLVTSDVAGLSGHYNFALGVIGLALGIGATVSTAAGGMLADRIGEPLAVACLAASAVVATLLAVIAMPETRPADG